ncbi:MAG TPA: cytochrome c [Candidatus Angelobacter sp.]|nr:cytochrome c [Candidatus Angelobacter sp.]
MSRRNAWLLIASLLLSATFLCAASIGDGAWKAKVPEKERARENPYDSQSDAIAAGAKLFRQNCASCHGNEATGTEKKPNLHSDRIRNSTPGELAWLLKNGSMKNGMPSWSRLPEQQRWQIVSYLKSLQ